VLAHYAPGDVRSAWRVGGMPMVKIECSGARCALRDLWAGFDAPAYHFRWPKTSLGETRTAMIGMSLVKAD
jgi:hypothetical protein